MKLVQIGSETVAMETRPCGDCSLCCKLLRIQKSDEFPFDKPRGEWCRHCAPGSGGCKIFDSGTLPKLCQDYACLWKLTALNLPMEARPDNLHAILEPLVLAEFPDENILKIILDPKYPESPWLTRYVARQLELGTSFIYTNGKILSNKPHITAALLIIS